MTAAIDTYLCLAEPATDLLALPAVAEAWDRPSALADFTVGGLATHLALQITRVPEVLAAPPPPPSAELLTVDGHYAKSRWVSAPHDSDVNAGIRATAGDKAAAGPAEILSETRAALAELRSTLPGETPDRAVFLPWTGWSLTVEGYLHTRGLEILVHSDDLAQSIGVETPEVPAGAARAVIDTLVTLSLSRHGVTAVLRALSRRERAPHSIAAI